jgi:hypothetical protein
LHLLFSNILGKSGDILSAGRHFARMAHCKSKATRRAVGNFCNPLFLNKFKTDARRPRPANIAERRAQTGKTCPPGRTCPSQPWVTKIFNQKYA